MGDLSLVISTLNFMFQYQIISPNHSHGVLFCSVVATDDFTKRLMDIQEIVAKDNQQVSVLQSVCIFVHSIHVYA